MKKININTVKRILKGIFFSALVAIITPSFALAVPINATLENPLKGTGTLNAFIFKILDIVTKIGAPIAILAIVYTGFLFVKAQGNETELAAAKKAFFWTIVGVLVLLGAKALGLAIKGTVANL